MNRNLENEWNIANQFFQYAATEEDIDKAISMMLEIEKEMGLEMPKY